MQPCCPQCHDEQSVTVTGADDRKTLYRQDVDLPRLARKIHIYKDVELVS